MGQSEARNPCSEVSCQALVRIDKIVKAGNGPASLLEEGQEVSMQFVYSLSPASEGLFPGLSIDYPGLKGGDRFEAAVEGRPGGQPYHYVVDHYLKLDQ